MEEQAMNYAIEAHANTNHRYDPTGKNLPYAYHLQMVVSTAIKHINLIPEEDRDIVLSACWCHDVIEDCRQNYNDVKVRLNEQVAELVYALTNEKGKTRAERGNEKYYKGIRTTPYASFCKLADRIANAQYSKDNGSSMFKKYMKENRDFLLHVVNIDQSRMYAPMINELIDLFK